MDISFYLLGAICIVVFVLMTRNFNALYKDHKALQRFLAELKKKSHVEQDLSLATTEQLMEQIQSRVPGFILITPVASNSQIEQGVNVHIKGLQPDAAISCMRFACQVIATNAPPHSGFNFEEV